MLKYISKRILYFIPTLFIISFLTFKLGEAAPGDAVETRLTGGMQGAKGGGISEKLAGEQAYIDMKKKLGLDLPGFYFTLGNQATPRDLYKVVRKKEKQNLERLILQYGNWEQIESYYNAVKSFDKEIFKVERNDYTYEGLKAIKESTFNLTVKSDEYSLSNAFANIEKAINTKSTVEIDSVTTEEKAFFEGLIAPFNALKGSLEEMKSKATPGKNKIPSIKWFGKNNQYHVWLFGNAPWFKESEDPSLKKGFIRGDFGESILDGRPVASLIKDALPITLGMNLIAMLIAYLVAIPLGVKLANTKDTPFDRVTTVLLFILYSLPVFWVATLFIVFLTTDHYGMDWFPTYGLQSVDLAEDASIFEIIKDRAHHLILPIIAMTYGSFTYLSRQMRGSMLGTKKQDFIRTAKAKGLSENVVTWKHVFRNSLIPIITMLASILPVMISGSVVIEVIFNISGMGRLGFDAVVARNYPVLFTVLMFSAILTMLGMLLADLMYSFVDPRITFTKKAK